jgi:hypothetical protein
MDVEIRKQYNKSYYQKNREKLLENACKKVECEFCKRTVSNVNLLKHYTLPICKRKAELLKALKERKNE